MSWKKYLENISAVIEACPYPAGWIREKGIPGDYNGRGRCVRLPYKAFLALTGFEEVTAKHDRRYAWYENLKLISRVEAACPYRGAIVITEVPDWNGIGAFTFTLTEPAD